VVSLNPADRGHCELGMGFSRVDGLFRIGRDGPATTAKGRSLDEHLPILKRPLKDADADLPRGHAVVCIVSITTQHQARRPNRDRSAINGYFEPRFHRLPSG
jgi:hypothetical protein